MKLSIILFSLALVTSNCVASSKSASKLSHYSTLAEKGEAKAQYELALYLLQGAKGAKDPEVEAFKWMEKSAKQGYELAQMEMGYFYELAIGTEYDLRKALEWYKRCEDQGNSHATERILILNYPLASNQTESVTSNNSISRELEAYYVEYLAQCYEKLASMLEQRDEISAYILQYSQHETRYFLSHTALPESYQAYIKEWRKSADRMLELVIHVPDTEYEQAKITGMNYIKGTENLHADISSALSFEQAKSYINQKYRMTTDMKNIVLISKALNGNMGYHAFKARFLRTLARRLRTKFLHGINARILSK